MKYLFSKRFQNLYRRIERYIFSTIVDNKRGRMQRQRKKKEKEKGRKEEEKK